MTPSRLIIPILILYLGVSLLAIRSQRLSTQVVEQELNKQIHIMVSAAKVVLGTASNKPGFFDPGDESAMDRLYDLEQAFSMENISLLDMVNRVVNTTNPLFIPGDDFPATVSGPEKALLASGNTVIRTLTDLNGSYFKTVIFPFKGAHETGAVMMDIDLSYLDTLGRLRRRFYYGYAASGALFLAVVILMLIIMKQLRASQAAKDKNEKLALMGKMSASIAHEIKNPLGIIKSSAQVLEKQLGGAGGETLSYITEEIDRLNQNINDYLSFARDITVDPETINAEDLIRGVIKDFPEVTFTDGGIGNISYDSYRLIQVLRNLLLNARQHGGGAIEVITSRDAGKSFIQVTDNGPGISPNILGNIFEPFHTSTKGGTGLGLNICRKIVELHGGTITAENKKTGGSIFTITIKENS